MAARCGLEAGGANKFNLEGDLIEDEPNRFNFLRIERSIPDIDQISLLIGRRSSLIDLFLKSAESLGDS